MILDTARLRAWLRHPGAVLALELRTYDEPWLVLTLTVPGLPVLILDKWRP